MKILGIVLAVLGMAVCLGIRLSSGPTMQANRDEWGREMAHQESKIRDSYAEQAQELADLQRKLAEVKAPAAPAMPDGNAELARQTAGLAAKLEALSAKVEQEKAKRADTASAAATTAEPEAPLKERQVALEEEIRAFSRGYDRLKPVEVSDAAANENFNPIPAT